MTDFQVLMIVLSLFSLNIHIFIGSYTIAHAIKDLKKKEDKDNDKEQRIKELKEELERLENE